MTDISLQACVIQHLDVYFETCKNNQIDDNITGVYSMVLEAVEKPLLMHVMQHYDNNQSAAAVCLGLNRNTLRSKLIKYGLI